MTGCLALLLATVAAIELAWATRVMACFAQLAATSARAQRMLRRRGVSEWAKERAMRLTSQRLMARSLRGAGLLLVVAMPFLVAGAIEAHRPFGLAQAYRDWTSRCVVLSLSLVYFALRRRSFPVAGRLERLWQRIALGNHAVLEMSFDLERARFHPLTDAESEAPVFIAGLARSGTTILTRQLHERHGFASLTYRDLPFPLAPNGWAALSGRMARRVERTERGHGDGIEHDLDSAEAIEEVFWRHHEGDRYVGPQGLSPVPPEPASIEAFRDYVGLIRRRYGGGRYLSKNNANVLRLGALIEAFPQALLVHPFRDPLQQAQSLLRQHRLALKLSSEDPFRASFMSWLGHHEFGPDQRPFRFPGHPPMEENRDHIDYWLQQWISVYRALLSQDKAVNRRQIFLDHDALCAEPGRYAAQLGEVLGLPGPFATQGLALVPPRKVAGADPALVDKARALHLQLRLRSDAAMSAVDSAA